jgi:hypothetical protein
VAASNPTLTPSRPHTHAAARRWPLSHARHSARTFRSNIRVAQKEAAADGCVTDRRQLTADPQGNCGVRCRTIRAARARRQTRPVRSCVGERADRRSQARGLRAAGVIVRRRLRRRTRNQHERGHHRQEHRAHAAGLSHPQVPEPVSYARASALALRPNAGIETQNCLEVPKTPNPRPNGQFVGATHSRR